MINRGYKQFVSNQRKHVDSPWIVTISVWFGPNCSFSISVISFSSDNSWRKNCVSIWYFYSFYLIGWFSKLIFGEIWFGEISHLINILFYCYVFVYVVITRKFICTKDLSFIFLLVFYMGCLKDLSWQLLNTLYWILIF